MQVHFFKVDNVDPATGSMQVKVWLRQRWSDLRLQWTPAAWGGVETLIPNNPNLEETDICAPAAWPAPLT